METLNNILTKPSLGTLLPGVALLTSSFTPSAVWGKQPNVLFFMVDDMGWQDTSVPFLPGDSLTAYNKMFHTPNMERLAVSGVKFTSAYACAISSPSRCSLITGANAARHGVTNWTLHKGKTTDEENPDMIPADWNHNGISRVDGTDHCFRGASWVEDLKRAGYHTIHCGKAHWGAENTPGEDPHHWGFEVNIAGSAAGGLATYLSERNYGHDENGKRLSPFAIEGLEKYWGTGTFVTEALTQEALSALDKAKEYNQPWLLYMSHYAVHVPIDRDERFYEKYRSEGLGEKDAAYASLVEGMDKSLGDLLDWIESNGEEENTIVVFMADNGGLAAHPGWRDGEIHTQNAPLKSGKGSLHEGGIREPMILRWPGHTTPSSSIDNYVMIEDFFPSILEMAGVQSQTASEAPVDGVSFVPLITGEGDPSHDRALIWNFPNVWGLEGPAIDMNCAIRKNDYKLIYDWPTGKSQLFNIKEDIGEKHDLSWKMPGKVKSMKAELASILRKRGAKRPKFKSTGKECAWPDGKK